MKKTIATTTSRIYYPAYIQPWIDTLKGQSGEGMLLQILLVFTVMLFLVGGHWRGRRSTSAGLAQGYDPATTAENDANRGGSASGGLFGWLEFKWELDLSQRLNHSIRSKTFDRIQRLPMRHFDDHQIGDAIFRVMYDTTAISELCFKLLGTPILAPLHILVASYILIVTYPSAPLIGQAALLSLPISLIAKSRNMLGNKRGHSGPAATKWWPRPRFQQRTAGGQK